MAYIRRRGEFTWDSFPTRKDAEGWHCRKCGVVLTGRKTSWCSRSCLKETLLLVDWRYIRRCILRRDKYRCRLCSNRAREVDHIVELADGGSFSDWSNLRSLCHACHQAKTNRLRGSRAALKKAKKAVLTDDNSEGWFMGSNFSKIKIGKFFKTSDGETFKKTTELTFDDMVGLEHYIDPFFDKKIGAAENIQPDVDTSARITKGKEEPLMTKSVKKPAKKTSKKKTKKTAKQ